MPLQSISSFLIVSVALVVIWLRLHASRRARAVQAGLAALARREPQWNEARLIELGRRAAQRARRERGGRKDLVPGTARLLAVAGDEFTVRVDDEIWGFTREAGEWRPRLVRALKGWRRFVDVPEPRIPERAAVLSPEERQRVLAPTLIAILALFGGIFALALWHPLDAWRVGVLVALIGVAPVLMATRLLIGRLGWTNLPARVMWTSKVYLCAGLMSLWLASVLALNALGDRSRPVESVSRVTGHYVSRSKNATRYMVRFPVGDSVESLAVTPEDYARAMTQGRVRVRVGAGFLGFPWLVSSRLELATADDAAIAAALAWTRGFDFAREIERLEPAEVRRETWPNGAIKSEEPIVAGQVHGLGVYHFANGRLYGEIPYRHGQKHGRFDLRREDGSLEQSLSYRDGRPHGLSVWYDGAGHAVKRWVYVDGAAAGELAPSDLKGDQTTSSAD